VVEGQTGFLVPVGDDEAMATACRALRDDPPLAARCGAAGRALVATRFTIGTMLEANEQLYDVLRTR
jgi:glycosyltransferase involved in cell wall biosynthesis